MMASDDISTYQTDFYGFTADTDMPNEAYPCFFYVANPCDKKIKTCPVMRQTLHLISVSVNYIGN